MLATICLGFRLAEGPPVWLEKQIEIPFLPAVGMYITDDGGWASRVQDMDWNIDENILTVDLGFFRNGELQPQTTIEGFRLRGWVPTPDDHPHLRLTRD